MGIRVRWECSQFVWYSPAALPYFQRGDLKTDLEHGMFQNPVITSDIRPGSRPGIASESGDEIYHNTPKSNPDAIAR